MSNINYSVVLTFFNKNLLTWRHCTIISSLLLSSSFSFSCVTIASFVCRYNGHFLVLLEYDGICLRIDHEISTFSPLSFIFHMYSANLVSFFRITLEIKCSCTRFFISQPPFNGHLSLIIQQHLGTWVYFSSLKILLLWLFII